MTWRWPIFFSWLSIAPAFAAVLSGRVELVNLQDPEVRKHKGYAGVVVWLEPASHPAPLPPRTAVMLQKGKRFIPHVLVVTAGTTVEFPNRDPIFHNAFSNFGAQPFDTGLYPPGGTEKVLFRREGIVRVFCNIHSSMSAVIVVLRTPHFAVTAPDGSFRINGLPAGEYELRLWHERATEQTLNALARRIVIGGAGNGAGAVRLGPIRISESGYVEVPHKNKYGQDYPPEPPQGPYPGGPP